MNIFQDKNQLHKSFHKWSLNFV